MAIELRINKAYDSKNSTSIYIFSYQNGMFLGKVDIPHERDKPHDNSSFAIFYYDKEGNFLEHQVINESLIYSIPYTESEKRTLKLIKEIN